VASIDEQVLRTAKEIVVKFIETGRVSPTGFPELFQNIYQTVQHAVRETAEPEEPAQKP
jgi:predicted transcriptional regulator